MQTYRSPSQHYAFKRPLTEAEWVTIRVGTLRKDNHRPNDTLSIPPQYLQDIRRQRRIRNEHKHRVIEDTSNNRAPVSALPVA